MKKNFPVLSSFSVFLFYVIQFTSCTSPKNVIYFQNFKKDTAVRNTVDDNFELKIRKNDLLNINIISPDPVSTPLFNGVQGISPNTTGAVSGSNPGGYLVDYRGNITMYKLGSLRVEGLTRNELKQKLQRELSPYLKDAVVTVTFLNNRVTILGEVTKPQVITMPTEQLSILEAMGMSGDILITGRKDNILLIRETPTGKQFKRLNLTDNSIFNSPFYNLQPDDIVYVEPTDVKIRNSGNTPQIIGYVLSGLSIVITLLLNLR